MKINEIDYNSIDNRSGTSPGSPISPRMKGSLRLSTVNTINHTGYTLRPGTGTGLVGDEYMGNMPASNTEFDADAPDKATLASFKPATKKVRSLSPRTKKPIISPAGRTHPVLRDFIKRHILNTLYED